MARQVTTAKRQPVIASRRPNGGALEQVRLFLRYPRRMARYWCGKIPNIYCRVGFGPAGSEIFTRLQAELRNRQKRFFLGAARDEWARALNLPAEDIFVLMDILRQGGETPRIAFRIGTKWFDTPARAARELKRSAVRRFELLVVERAVRVGIEAVNACSLIDIRLWSRETSFGDEAIYSSQGTAPFVSRLRSSAYEGLLGSGTDLDADREDLLQDVGFKIDAVYTWVNDQDPDWTALKASYSGRSAPVSARSDHPERFRNRDELRYSLRSLEMFAPFIDKIYIVTNGQVPAWLRPDHPRIRLVTHDQIYARKADLPTFNSSGIETQLHHIEGLAEHFLYLNDDFFFGRFCTAGDFFFANGAMKFFRSEQAVFERDMDDKREAYIVADANAIALMKRDLGRIGRELMLHVPYPSRRSYLDKLEKRYAREFATCAANRFRAASDIRPIAFMQYHFGFAEGIAYPGRISHRYLSLWKERIERQFEQALRTREYQTLCVNDVGVKPEDVERTDAMVADFLKSYFPFPSSFEIGDVPPDGRQGNPSPWA